MEVLKAKASKTTWNGDDHCELTWGAMQDGSRFKLQALLEAKEKTKGEAHVIRKPSRRHGLEQRAGKMSVSIAWELARQVDVIRHIPCRPILSKWIRWKPVDKGQNHWKI